MVLLYFKDSHINLVHECELLGIVLSSNITTDNAIEKTFIQFNIKSNEVISDYRFLPCYIQTKLRTDICYGISN